MFSDMTTASTVLDMMSASQVTRLVFRISLKSMVLALWFRVGPRNAGLVHSSGAQVLGNNVTQLGIIRKNLHVTWAIHGEYVAAHGGRHLVKVPVWGVRVTSALDLQRPYSQLLARNIRRGVLRGNTRTHHPAGG